MNWAAIGAIGEIIGAAAVVLSLAYLAVQVRQNTRSVRAASFHGITDSFNHLNGLLASDASLAQVFRRGLQDLSSLDPDERIRFDFLVLGAFRIFETLFYQSRQGTGEQVLWRAEEGTMRALLSNPGLRDWWNSNPLSFTPQFRTLVDTLIRGVPS